MEAGHKLDFILTKENPHHALLGELWGVYFEDFLENIRSTLQ